MTLADSNARLVEIDTSMRGSDSSLFEGFRGDVAGQGNCIGLGGVLLSEVDKEALPLAKEICVDCPVLGSCAVNALFGDDVYGVAGGLTMHDRKLIKRGMDDSIKKLLKRDDAATKLEIAARSLQKIIPHSLREETASGNFTKSTAGYRVENKIKKLKEFGFLKLPDSPTKLRKNRRVQVCNIIKSMTKH